MKNITTALTTKVTELTGGVHNSFYTAIGGRWYDTQAPTNGTTPYAVYQVISSVHEWEFNEEFQNLLLQISIVDGSSSGGTIKDIGTYCKALFDGATLTITGKSTIFMRWEIEQLYKDEDGDWLLPMDFRLYVSTP